MGIDYMGSVALQHKASTLLFYRNGKLKLEQTIVGFSVDRAALSHTVFIVTVAVSFKKC